MLNSDKLVVTMIFSVIFTISIIKTNFNPWIVDRLGKHVDIHRVNTKKDILFRKTHITNQPTTTLPLFSMFILNTWSRKELSTKSVDATVALSSRSGCRHFCMQINSRPCDPLNFCSHLHTNFSDGCWGMQASSNLICFTTPFYKIIPTKMIEKLDKT